jgi:hypothetical protein
LEFTLAASGWKPSTLPSSVRGTYEPAKENI